MNSIILEGRAAVDERKRLLVGGKEVAAALKERDARGRERTTSLQFGLGPRAAWVWCRDEREGMEPQTTLEVVLVEEAPELLGGYVERMELRQCLIDPSPLSAEMVEISPCIQDLVEQLALEFGIKINL